MEAWGEEAPAARFVPPEFKAEIVDCASEGIGRWARSRGISTWLRPRCTLGSKTPAEFEEGQAQENQPSEAA
jgi:hypothetical protein